MLVVDDVVVVAVVMMMVVRLRHRSPGCGVVMCE